MELYDISVTLSDAMPAYPGDPPLSIAPDGDPFVVSALSFGSHSGTHLDLPGHIGLSGAQPPLETLIGPCRVWDLTDHRGPIDAAALARHSLAGCRRLLLKSANSRLWAQPDFRSDYQALTPDGAAWLVRQGVALVGIDYLSVEPDDGDGGVHRTLLEAGVVVVEGLDLSAIAAGGYELICLPLKLACGDGAPCRAVLRRP